MLHHPPTLQKQMRGNFQAPRFDRRFLLPNRIHGKNGIFIYLYLHENHQNQNTTIHVKVNLPYMDCVGYLDVHGT